MKKLCTIFIALFLGIVMAFGAVGCNADSSEFQKKIDDLQSQIAELEDKLGERDATIEELNEQIKKQEEKIEQLEKELEEEKMNGKEPVGSLYTLQEAYDNGWLTQEELLSIAYYHHSQTLGSNSSLTFNTELMGENFQPIEKSPETLSTLLNNTIRQTVLNDLNNEFDSNSFELKQIYIGAYYGAYNGGVAVIILYSRGDDIALNDVIHEDVVANVTFYYSAYTVFFHTVSYSLSNTIMFYKENK